MKTLPILGQAERTPISAETPTRHRAIELISRLQRIRIIFCGVLHEENGTSSFNCTMQRHNAACAHLKDGDRQFLNAQSDLKEAIRFLRRQDLLPPSADDREEFDEGMPIGEYLKYVAGQLDTMDVDARQGFNSLESGNTQDPVLDGATTADQFKAETLHHLQHELGWKILLVRDHVVRLLQRLA